MAGTSRAQTRFALLPGHDEKANHFQAARNSLKILDAFWVSRAKNIGVHDACCFPDFAGGDIAHGGNWGA